MRSSRVMWAVALLGCGEGAVESGGVATDGARDRESGVSADAARPSDARPEALRPGPRPDAVSADARGSDAGQPTDLVSLDTAPPPPDAAPPPPDAAPPPRFVTARNPVLPGDHPDPHVLRTVDDQGPLYLLTHTVDTGDFPLWQSRDLVTWSPSGAGLFQRGAGPGGSTALGAHHYCHLWAPAITALPGGYMLSFTATRFDSPPNGCPPYREDSGVYLAWSPTPSGPFARADHPWEPLPAGGQISNCGLRDQLPRSVDTAVDDCLGGFCHQVIRLDSDVFQDPADGRWWLAYSWYTNSPPRVDWERSNHGEHVEIVELDAADPFAVRCDPNVPQIFAANPHDGATLQRLRDGCPRCGEMLANDRGRQDEAMVRDGSSWGVAEGASLFRRGPLVYLMVSGSAWDSAYYHVYWVAAPTVEGLSWENPDRLVGRHLIPGQGNAFGHGSAVLGPDGEHWYFVHHRLRHPDCRDRGDCARDLWVSPIEFEDRGDGRGDVWIAPRFPSETPETEIRL